MINKAFVDTLMTFMPTPEEADAMGLYDDVVEGNEVFSYKGEYLGTVQEVADKKWYEETFQKMVKGEISEYEFERMCEERG